MYAKHPFKGELLQVKFQSFNVFCPVLINAKVEIG